MFRPSPARDTIFGELTGKSLGEISYRPVTQNLGVVPFDEETDDMGFFIACAKGYRLEHLEKQELCIQNAEIANQAGHFRAAELWTFAATLLENIIPNAVVDLGSANTLVLPHSISAPSTIPTISPPSLKPLARRSVTEATPTKLVSSKSAAMRILSTNNPQSRKSSPGLTPSPSGSPSPLRRTIQLPTLPLIDATTFSLPGSASSTPLRERPPMFRVPTGFDPNARRPSLTPSLLSVTSPGSRSPSERAISSSYQLRVGEGALDGSSDEEDAEAAEEAGDERDEGEDDDYESITPMRTPLRARPSPFSQLTRQSWVASANPNGSSSDEASFVPPQPVAFQRRSSLRKKKERRESFNVGSDAKSGHLNVSASAPRLNHQVSASSINTVTAGAEAPWLANALNGTQDIRHSADISIDASSRRATPSEESDDDNVFMHLSRAEQEKIAIEEKKLREMGWTALKEDMEALSDEVRRLSMGLTWFTHQSR